MIVSINQPAYLPWLGYFDRIAASDIHVVLDHVQFEKNSFVNRNRIRTSQGWTWLTVPVQTKGSFGDLAINKLKIASGTRWERKHWQTIEQNYAKAPFFAEYRDAVKALYEQPRDSFISLSRAATDLLISAFSVDTRMIYSSSLPVSATKSDLVLEICCQLEASTYLSGTLGRDYLDRDAFAHEGIEVIFQDYRHPLYGQVYPGFEENMAAIDLLFMRGEEAADMLRTTGMPLNKEGLRQ